jgi:amino acid permease
MTGLELLDSVPFTVFLILYAIAVVVVLVGSVVLRWKLRQMVMSSFLFAGAVGSLVGLIVVAAPHVYVLLESEVTGMLTGHYGSNWPPSWWPYWLGSPLGPFRSFAFGTVSGWIGGCVLFWWFKMRRESELK